MAPTLQSGPKSSAALIAHAATLPPIAPPAPETPDYVDFVTPDLSDFLMRLLDPQGMPS
jgi:hypothetical protein